MGSGKETLDGGVHVVLRRASTISPTNLSIVGGRRLGQSMLAADVCRRVAAKIGLADFLEITVEDSEQIDLADFDRSIHAGVVLDGVGDALF